MATNVESRWGWCQCATTFTICRLWITSPSFYSNSQRLIKAETTADTTSISSSTYPVEVAAAVCKYRYGHLKFDWVRAITRARRPLRSFATGASSLQLKAVCVVPRTEVPGHSAPRAWTPTGLRRFRLAETRTALSAHSTSGDRDRRRRCPIAPDSPSTCIACLSIDSHRRRL